MTYLVVMSVIMGILGGISLFNAGFAIMVFDAPGSERNPATIATFVAEITLPLVCLIALFLAWSHFCTEDYTIARLVILLPLVNIAVIALAYLCHQFFYGGKFNG